MRLYKFHNNQFELYYGIYITSSNNNIFLANNLNYNSYGIYLNTPSSGNIIHHNNFYYNGFNALDETENINLWDNGKKGNYWGDYKEKYPNARIIWLKGIWNTPYEIPNKENKDRCPLIIPHINLKEKKVKVSSINFFVKILDNYLILKIFFKIDKFLNI